MIRKFFWLITITLLLSCSIQNQYLIDAGNLDLSSYDFEEQGNLLLKGEVYFFGNRYIKPEEIDLYLNKAKKIRFPGTWNNLVIDGEKLSGKGYGTYYFKIILNRDNNDYTLLLNDRTTAYRIFANQKLIGKSGEISDNIENTKLEFTPQKVFFPPDGTESLHIVMHVANPVFLRGGFNSSIELGTNRNICNRERKLNFFDSFLLGCLIMMGFYYLTLYFSRKKQVVSLVFSFICFFTAFRIAFMGQILSTNFFNIPWELHLRLVYFSFFSISILYVSFIFLMFPKEIFRKCVYIYYFIQSSLIVLVLFFPLYIVVRGLLVSYLATSAIGFLGIYTFIMAMKHKRGGALLFFLAYIPTFIFVLNDILYAAGYIPTGYYAINSLYIQFLLQALILAMRFSKAFTMVEVFSEKLLSLDKLKDDFLANTSHELRTPLNGIIGIAQTLKDNQDNKLNEEQCNDINIIISCGKRLSGLIDDILDYSKLKNEKLSLNLCAVDLNQMVSFVLALSIPLIQEKDIKLINNIPDNFPLLLADENRLQQILLNLIGNAIKFTEHGEIRIDAKSTGDYAEISISDTGPGIPEEKHELIFHSFKQADGSVNREYGGTGLGLSITKHLVELHQGTIKVESIMNKGSTFIFTLPVTNMTNKKIKVNPKNLVLTEELLESKLVYRSKKKKSKIKGTEKTILLVDDDPVNIKVLLNYLSSRDFKFLIANNGQESLDIVRNNPDVDIVLLDVMMPKMSGYETCKIIREEFSIKKEDLPILLLTAKNQPENVVEGFMSGANDYIPKPITKEELIARIDFHLVHSTTTKDLKSLKANLEKMVDERTQNLETTLAKLHEANTTLEELTIKDGLTGVFNRRYFNQHLHKEWKRVYRSKSELSLMLIDIDHFKKVNDTYGHQCGDNCLKELVRNISETLKRETDALCRYGGEEFAVILPETPITGALILAENIRKVIENMKFQFEGERIPVTISIGVSTIHGGKKSESNQLISNADKELYKAKETGRNKVCPEKI